MSPSTKKPEPLLDHVVILVPHAFLLSPPPWLAESFTLYPGGQHRDGVTENVLVFFADGSYLELIAFVDNDTGEKGRPGHRWGAQKEGSVIDWALTLLSDPTGDDDPTDVPESTRAEFQEIQRGVKAAGAGGIGYQDLVGGGRNRPDGEVLKWATSSAEDAAAGKPLEPGVLPFWCLDVTDRLLRVPYREQALAKHASGAVGVAVLQVAPPSSSASDLRPMYDVLFSKVQQGDDSRAGRWTVETPEPGHHKGGEVHLVEQGASSSDGGKKKLSLKLFTTSPGFAGRKIGGPVTDQIRLEFEFVSAK
ncbi:glyoxalase-like domain-containing protein [Apiospora arundinis]|uniref:Glyoxalase-like domain-containing protein n=1 Tax=Apiospora arundinis TaxID=335852 RepID=A0ABR2JBS6_9PEZI